MNPKYQKVCAEIAKTEKKVEDLQEKKSTTWSRRMWTPSLPSATWEIQMPPAPA